MNVAQALLQALKDHGATRVFGIPGDFALPFFKVIEESAILPLHTLSHEPDGLGGVGQRVTTRRQLADALARAIAGRGRFQLIEIMLARGAMSQTLARFAAALSARRAAVQLGG